MPKWHQVSFPGLELKALWVRATGGDTSNDTLLDQAGDIAVDKLYRAEKGLPRRANPEPVGGRTAGPPLDLRRS